MVDEEKKIVREATIDNYVNKLQVIQSNKITCVILSFQNFEPEVILGVKLVRSQVRHKEMKYIFKYCAALPIEWANASLL